MIIKPDKKNVNYELFSYYENELKKVLKDDIIRYFHSISVAITAVNLASVYGANHDNVLVAGLLHDYSKCIPKNEIIAECEKYNIKLTEEDKKADGCLHGFLAAKVCKEKYNINDEIYNAIYYHTCGRPNMSLIEKIIYISDFIEPLRRFRNTVTDIRKLAFCNIDKAIVLSAELNLNYLKNSDKFIHSNTEKTLEYYKNII